MSLQIHAVMQHSEHIDYIAALNVADAENDEVAPLAPVSGNMERPDVVADFGPLLDPGERRAGA